MSSFRKRADMLILPLTLRTGCASARRDWSRYDAPAWRRLGRPDPLREREISFASALPAFLRRQAG